LRDEAARHYGPWSLRATRLDPYLEYLNECIEHARPDWIPATVPLRETRERGYPVGIGVFIDLLRLRSGDGQLDYQMN
jgi:transposase